MYFLRRFIYKIIQVCQWLSVIWNDEDWDFEYLLVLIQYKLKRMKACLWNNRIIEHKELRDTIIDINKCVSAIEEYRDSHEIYEELYEKCPINISMDKTLTDAENHAYCEWVRNVHEFEQKKWEEIWNRLKDNAQKFWD